MPQLELEGMSMHYDQLGDGPDLVWIAGGGMLGSHWHRWLVPYFADSWRQTTFDNRGIGGTSCNLPEPWTIADMARDAAALIDEVCDPPVAAVGLSMGSLIAIQLALDRPDLLLCAVAMGTFAHGHRGWVGDYMRAQVALRRQGAKLDGMFAVIHYAAELYPARVLGDGACWPAIRDSFSSETVSENERSLIPQWQACIDFDVVARLPGLRVPLHVFAFSQDVQAPPQYGRQVADLVPGAEYHVFEGMGHASALGHAHDVLNPAIQSVIRHYLR